MIGVRYIHAVSKTGYKSAKSGKNAARLEINRATPNEKASRNIMETGSNKAEGLIGILDINRINPSGIKDKMKLTMLARIVETTKDVLGR
jgi:hypothetical protein